MPTFPHQFHSSIPFPSQSLPDRSQPELVRYSQTQPPLPLASVPRGMADFGAYDVYVNEALQSINNPRQHIDDPEGYTRLNDAYSGVVNFQYHNETPPEVIEGYWPSPSDNDNSGHLRPLEHHMRPQPGASSSYYTNSWGHLPSFDAQRASTSCSNYSSNHYTPPDSSHSLGPYSAIEASPNTRRSRSSDLIISPYTSTSQLSPSPETPNPVHPKVSADSDVQIMDGYREQLKLFKEALQLPLSFNAGPFVPQKMYMPHTNSDRRRYVEEIELQQPIYFWMQEPDECGIPLIDALHSRVRRLRSRDEPVFEGRGPSISVRIQWPGYRPWSRQIPTKDFRSPPQPITKAKLAKNVAKCVERFLSARTGTPLEDDVDARWKVGPRTYEIKLEDLYLVSMHHVSMGSWQPHLRLRRPLAG